MYKIPDPNTDTKSGAGSYWNCRGTGTEFPSLCVAVRPLIPLRKYSTSALAV